MAVVEQVTSDTGKYNSVVFVREQLEQMLVPQFSGGALGDHTTAHTIGEGFLFVEQRTKKRKSDTLSPFRWRRSNSCCGRLLEAV